MNIFPMSRVGLRGGGRKPLHRAMPIIHLQQRVIALRLNAPNLLRTDQKTSLSQRVVAGEVHGRAYRHWTCRGLAFERQVA